MPYRPTFITTVENSAAAGALAPACACGAQPCSGITPASRAKPSRPGSHSAMFPLWWGVLLLVLGMITAFIGGLYALMEHNIQRLLAYHTLENIGIILLGLGAFVTGIATGNNTSMASEISGIFLPMPPSFSISRCPVRNHTAPAPRNSVVLNRLWWRMGYLSILLQAEHRRGVYRPSAGAAAGGWPGDYRGAGGDGHRHQPHQHGE
jgi:hypothetical protein